MATLLSLPAEIRIAIYHALFEDVYLRVSEYDDPYYNPFISPECETLKAVFKPESPIGLLATNKFIRDEVLSSLGARLVLVIDIFDPDWDQYGHWTPHLSVTIPSLWKTFVSEINLIEIYDLDVIRYDFPNLRRVTTICDEAACNYPGIEWFYFGQWWEERRYPPVWKEDNVLQHVSNSVVRQAQKFQKNHPGIDIFHIIKYWAWELDDRRRRYVMAEVDILNWKVVSITGPFLRR